MSNTNENTTSGLQRLYGAGCRTVVGSSIMVLTGVVIDAGHGTPLAFILGALFGNRDMCSVYYPDLHHTRIRRRLHLWPKRLMGDKADFMYIGMFVLSRVLIATFAKGFASYFCSIFFNSRS